MEIYYKTNTIVTIIIYGNLIELVLTINLLCDCFCVSYKKLLFFADFLLFNAVQL